jgi:hypothetical protein
VGSDIGSRHVSEKVFREDGQSPPWVHELGVWAEPDRHREVVDDRHALGATLVQIEVPRIRETRPGVDDQAIGEGHVVGVGPLAVVPEHVVPETERDLRGVLIHVP